jgi:hypothetical protein
MCPSSFVGVAEDHHVLAAQGLAVFVSPFARTTGIGGRDDANLREVVSILLTFSDRNGSRLDYFRQLIQNSANIGCVPCPFAVPVWFALSKVFRLESADLKKQSAILICIIVRGDWL